MPNFDAKPLAGWYEMQEQADRALQSLMKTIAGGQMPWPSIEEATRQAEAQHEAMMQRETAMTLKRAQAAASWVVATHPD
ncbi:hypothetical protein [Xylophilus sp. GOD-11R]|uniref:hypothetical protein n=1 Tax=Xylophilus sp. GOD-11R TaxID=3089814 RepID=UPI00298BD014|nr:hypothetical protein [Xylophilus sp. GOD-11R]WPB55186.1 hypothetical protein R9X41_13590 [Xylophilus sp. GOD-11R]